MKAVDARTKVLTKIADAGVLQVSQGEFVWESPTVCGYPLLGLDTESPPVTQKGQAQGTVSWLQVSGLRESFLFDLPALNTDSELLVGAPQQSVTHFIPETVLREVVVNGQGSRADALITALFAEAGLVKLGQGFVDDLKLLRRGYPSWKAWRSMRNLLDGSVPYQRVNEISGQLELERNWALDGDVMGTPRQWQPAPQINKGAVSLAKLTAYALGRPLDKKMQMSDWSVRPLSAAQKEYAALDARVLLSIAAVLDKQLAEGVKGRAKLKKARARAREAAEAAAAQAAAEAAAVVEAKAAEQAARVAAEAAAAVEDDSSSIGSSVDSQSRRYSASSTDSTATNSTTPQADGDMALDAAAATSAAAAIDADAIDGSHAAVGEEDPEAKRIREHEAQTKKMLMEIDMNFGFAPTVAQTIELLQPGVHCYLPRGKDCT